MISLTVDVKALFMELYKDARLAFDTTVGFVLHYQILETWRWHETPLNSFVIFKDQAQLHIISLLTLELTSVHAVYVYSIIQLPFSQACVIFPTYKNVLC